MMGAVRGADAARSVHPIGLEPHLQIPGAFGIPGVAQLPERRCSRAAAAFQLCARIDHLHAALLEEEPFRFLGDLRRGDFLLADERAVQHQRLARHRERPAPFAELPGEAGIDSREHLRGADAARVAAERLAEFRRGHEAVVGGQHRHVIVAPDRDVEIVHEILQRAIEVEHVVVRDARLRTVCVVHVVVAGEAHRENVGRGVAPEAFPGDRGARERQRELVAEGAREDLLVEKRAGRLLALTELARQLSARREPRASVGNRARVRRLREERFPLLVEIGSRRLRRVEILHPLGMLLHVVGGRGELPGLALVDVGRSRLARGHDRAAVLARDRDHLRARVEALQDVAERLDLEVLRARAVEPRGPVADVGGRGVAGAVLGLAVHGVAPGVGDDSGAVRIGSGEEGRVAGAGLGGGVPVVRIGKPRAAVEEALEAVGSELVPILDHLALRQAVDDEEHHEPRPIAAHRSGHRLRRAAARHQGERREQGKERFSHRQRFFHESAWMRRAAQRVFAWMATESSMSRA